MKYRIVVTYNDDTNRVFFINSETEINYNTFKLNDYIYGPANDGIISLGIFNYE